MLTKKKINKIIFAIESDHLNDDILNISVETSLSNEKINIDENLTKTKTINNINIYQKSCNIFYDDTSVVINLKNNLFDNLLKGNGEIYILEDDIHYNHVNDLCINACHPINYEIPYSVYFNFYKKSAITLFIDPLKYPELVSLVLFEFLTINNYPQDIKNCILLLYNND